MTWNGIHFSGKLDAVSKIINIERKLRNIKLFPYLGPWAKEASCGLMGEAMWIMAIPKLNGLEWIPRFNWAMQFWLLSVLEWLPLFLNFWRLKWIYQSKCPFFQDSKYKDGGPLRLGIHAYRSYIDVKINMDIFVLKFSKLFNVFH